MVIVNELENYLRTSVNCYSNKLPYHVYLSEHHYFRSTVSFGCFNGGLEYKMPDP
jgi:hypothetical protein